MGRVRSRVHRALLRVWRDVPFPWWQRSLALRLMNDTFLVGVAALVQDDQGRVLVLEHTYRRRPWGLPGGALNRGETLEAGLAREVLEETGFTVAVGSLLAAHALPHSGCLVLLYRCSILSGAYRPNDETCSHRWVPPEELLALVDRDAAQLLRKVREW